MKQPTTRLLLPGLSRAVLALTAVAFFMSCTKKDLQVDAMSVNPTQVSGSVAQFSSFSTLATCTGGVAAIYSLDATGTKTGSALAQSALESDGSFKIDITNTGIDLKASKVKYQIEIAGCAEALTRPLTASKDQVVSRGSTLIEKLARIQDAAKKNVTEVSPASVEQLLKDLNSLGSTSLEGAYADAVANTSLATSFQSTFNTNITNLIYSKPLVSAATVPTTLVENTASNFSVTAVHWSSTYNLAYEWILDNVVVSNSSTYAFTPNKNQQGTKSLELRVGWNNGSNGVDATKAYFTQAQSIAISNTYPAIVPALTLTSSAVTNSSSVTMSLATGAALVNCASFSNLALTEDNIISPLLPFYYTISCSTSPTQTLNHTLSGSDGIKTLRLWAMDAAGNISASAQSVSITLDQTAPGLAVTNLSSVIKGGSSVNIAYAVSDATSGLASAKLQYAADGTTFADIAGGTITSVASPFVWTAPSANVTGAKIRVVGTDNAGNTTTATTAAFDIDNTAPSAPTIARTSSDFSNSTAVVIAVSCIADYDKILFSESSTTPAVGSASWETCAATKNFTVSTGDGLKTIYAFTKDAVGNISSSSNVTLTLDQTSPVISLTTPTALKGNSTEGTLSWTLTEANVAASTNFTVEIYDGTSWASVGTKAATAGANAAQAYSLTNFSVPSVNVTTAKLRVSLTDKASNATTSETAAFTVDSAAPVLSSASINDDALYAGSTVVNMKVNLTDLISSGIKVRLALANAGTGACQSEYLDDNWISWTGSTQLFPFVVQAVDGTKKLCVWARDAVGNISVISPTAGTAGVNTDSIVYSAGNAPVVTQFVVTRNSDGTRTIPAGQVVKIEWAVSDAESLDNNPIAISYTTDNTTWKDVVTGLDINVAANQTWLGGLTGNPTTGSGTYTSFNSPSGSYFRMQIVARDFVGNKSVVAQSNALNTGSWSVFAGTKDRGDGGTGLSATFEAVSVISQYAIDPKKGDIYTVDTGRGIRKLDVKTGIVSSFIKNGANNIPANGEALPTAITVGISGQVRIKFDSSGRLYLLIPGSSTASAVIYQFDLVASTARRFLGSATSDKYDSTATPANVFLTGGEFAFDESNSIYFFTSCDPYQTTYSSSSMPFRIMKVTQDVNGIPVASSVVAGNCVWDNPTAGPQNALTSPLGKLLYVGDHSALAVWNNGNNIVYTGGAALPLYKIDNGNLYLSSITNSTSGAILSYSNDLGKLYFTTTTGDLYSITLTPNANNGDTLVPVVTSNGTGSCYIDGVSALSACARAIGPVITNSSGTIFFSDGKSSYGGNEKYRIRYIDQSSKLRTIFGTRPFFGEGLDKTLARAAFSGVYYKGTGESNTGIFPAGLYFVDPVGMVLGRIKTETDQSIQLLWGNQIPGTAIDSSTESFGTDKSLGSAYVYSMKALAFASGLPMLRTGDGKLLSTDATGKVRPLMTGTASWENAANSANPLSYKLYVDGGMSNFTLKDDGLFVGGGYYTAASNPGLKHAFKYFDFTASSTKIIIGGWVSSYTNPVSDGDKAAGQAVNANLSYLCTTQAQCYMQYVSTQDRLYFGENEKFRYMYKPTDTTQSTLVTVFTLTGGVTVRNFIMAPDNSFVIYLNSSGQIKCYDISSGKTWCDNSTNLYPYAGATSIGPITVGPNQFTWKDSATLFVSNYNGEILQYNLPP